jgi:hypothetical protein
MTKPFLLFAIKCSVIMYFAACTSIENYTIAKTATPVVTKGVWKVKLFQDANNDKTNDFAGYTFTFNMSGNVKASKNGIDINGSWAEDDISKKITLNLDAKDPALTRLNNYWNITGINKSEVNLQNNTTVNTQLNITTL